MRKQNGRINRTPFFLHNKLPYFYETVRQRRNVPASENLEGHKVKCLKAILLNICNLYSRLYIFSSHFQSTCPLYEFEEGYSFSAMLDHHAWNHKHRFFFLKISSLHHPPRSFYRDAFLGPRWWGPVV